MMLRHAPHLERQVLWEGVCHPPTSAASGATPTIPVQPRNQRGEFPVRPVVVAAGVLPNGHQNNQGEIRVLNGKIVC
jgi:hypothetical protein